MNDFEGGKHFWNPIKSNMVILLPAALVCRIQKPFECENCEEAFTRKEVLIKHFAQVHGTVARI